MIRSEVVIFPREQGERQRVQVARPESWESLRFFRPAPDPAKAFARMTSLFRQHLIPRYPWLYGQLLFFRLPETVPLPDEPVGLTGDLRLALGAKILRDGVKIANGEPKFRTEAARQLYDTLSKAGCAVILRGSRCLTTVCPVREELGFLTDSAPEQGLAVNLSFFVMDPLEMATPYDFFGRPVGLRVKDGVIESPPQYGRPMLLVMKDGAVRIARGTEESRLVYAVKGHRLTGIRERMRFPMPDTHGKTVLTVAGGQVMALSDARRVPIPASGYTAVLEEETPAALGDIRIGDPVTVTGMEDVLFGIQVGPTAVMDGEPVLGLPQEYWHVRQPLRNLLGRKLPYTPPLYPCRPNKDRAPRMVIGADAEGKPIILWFEGAAKSGHIPGEDSCGASIAESALLARELGMVNGIHVDGGGSAQILIDRQRSLLISDRNRATGEESERAVPTGIVAE